MWVLITIFLEFSPNNAVFSLTFLIWTLTGKNLHSKCKLGHRKVNSLTDIQTKTVNNYYNFCWQVSYKSTHLGLGNFCKFTGKYMQWRDVFRTQSNYFSKTSTVDLRLGFRYVSGASFSVRFKAYSTELLQ